MNLQEMIRRQQEIVSAAEAEGRELNEAEQREFDELQARIDAIRGSENGNESGNENENETDTQRAVAAERQRISEIRTMCDHFGIDARQYIDNGTTLEDAQRSVMDQLMRRNTPVSARHSVSVTQDEADKFRRAAADGLLMRAGVNIERPADGAASFRGMSLRSLAIECLTREGQDARALNRKSSEDLLVDLTRQSFNPSASFPAIMDQSIRKSIVEQYNKVPTTFQEFTTKGTLADFKESKDHEYAIGGVGDFLKVPENGEIKASAPRTELLPGRKLETYGRSFSMTRQAFINDDIGFLTEVPGLYATAAKKTIDKQVYKILFDNPAIFDGAQLFGTAHKNVVATGSKPTQAAIQEMILQMQKQTDQFGDAIYMTPKTIVVPVGYEFDLTVIFRSTQLTGSSNNDVNPLHNYPIQVVQSPVLNAMAGSGACPWFIIADPSSARGIQVDYLNGQETPTIRRMEAPNVLGFVWDIWLDWGIAVRDFRGMVKNPGVAL